jgi:O-antigen/teichoic acid export membrane protein
MTGRNPIAALLRSDALVMVAAQVANGVCAYIFLGITTRQLGDVEFAPMSVAWTAFFLLGTGGFLPLEQQLSRQLAARFATGHGAGPIIRRGIVVLVSGVLLVTLLQLAAAPLLADELFSGRYDVMFGLAIGVAGFATLHVGRGISAGLSRPHLWASLFVVEGALEVLCAVALLVADNRDAGTFALLAGGSSLAAGVIVLGSVVPGLVRTPQVDAAGHHDVGATTAEPSPSLLRGIPALLVSSSLIAMLISAGPITIALLAKPSEEAEAGHFLTGLVVARVPVFLVPVITSLMLPSMSAAVAGEDHAAFRRTVKRMGGLVGAAVAVSTIGAAALGPTAVRLGFGDDFAVLGSRDLAALAFASVALVGAVALGQGVIALRQEGRLTVAWLAAAVAFFVSVALGDDLRTRVEAGLVVSSFTALVVVAGLVAAGSRRPFVHTEVPGPAHGDC